MVEQCVHILADGHTCRRIPKQGQKLCPAHSRQPRRRAPLGEDDAFQREIASFLDGFERLPLPELLNHTVGLLAEIRLLMDRYASRRSRLAFQRAAAAVGIAGDRLDEALRGLPPTHSPQPLPATPHREQLTTQRLHPETLARVERAEAILNSGRPISASEIDEIIRELDSCTQ